MALALAGIQEDPQVLWDNISLQDETEMANARLANAQAAALEEKLAGEHPQGTPAAGLRNGGTA